MRRRGEVAGRACKTRFPLNCLPIVEMSILIQRYAIIFFSLPRLLHYHIENNTSQRICGIGAMRFLPLFLDTAAGVIVLVGSGEPALGKLRLLRAAGAHVRWFARGADIAEEFLTPPEGGGVEISAGDPLKPDLSAVVAIVAAAGDALDARVAQRARAQRVLVNVVARPELPPFISPAIVDRGEV